MNHHLQTSSQDKLLFSSTCLFTGPLIASHDTLSASACHVSLWRRNSISSNDLTWNITVGMIGGQS